MLQIFDPADAQEVYRNEGKHPNRGDVFRTFRVLSETRPDVFNKSGGLLVEEGETWQNFRSKVQQDLMRPKSALFYLDKISSIADEMVDFVRRERDSDKMLEDFLPVAHRFGLESINIIALNSRLGCFGNSLPEDVRNYMESIEIIVKKFPDLLLKFPWWKILPRRWVPLFRLLQDNYNVVVDFVRGNIQEAIEETKKGMNKDLRDQDLSVLDRLILRNGADSPITFIMAFDMILAGIDTTGNTFAFLLYQLSRYPDKQEKLRQEILSFNKANLTAQDIGQMRYFRACFQESLRLIPTAANMVRILPQDTIIRGYKVPAGTMCTWYTGVMGRNPDLFSDPDKFHPERWIDAKHEIHPFAVRNFSHGPRMCIGKRFAELEVQVATLKMIQNFRVEWAANYELNPITELTNVPDLPLKMRFVDI